MEHGVSANDYKDFILFLATAGVVVPLFKRLRISPILGFLGAGVALGPFGLGALSETFPWLDYFTVANPRDIRMLAELGVVFLLFMIGLELSWDRLRLLRRMVFGLGGLQVLVSMAILAVVVFITGAGPGAALAAGAALALSSTAIVVPILGEQKRMHSPTGRAAFSVLLFQDLAVAPILITLALLGGSAGSGGGRTEVVVTVLQAIAGLAAVIIVGRLLLRPMFKSVARAKSEELFMATCLLVVIGAGSLTAMAGLSMALGAFIAGLLLAETEYRHEVEVTIEPFKGLFLGLFFVSMGIGLNLRVLADQPMLVLSLAAAFISLKTLTITALSRLFGLKLMDALETGLLLGAGGEFAFVIMNQAMGSGIVREGLGEAVMMSASISMFLIPALAVAARKLRALQRRSPVPETAPEPPALIEDSAEQRVLVVGYGRVGVMVGDLLDRHQLPWVAIDRDPRLVEQGRRRNHRVYFGEASRVDFLHRCGLEKARAVVVTMDSPEAVEAVVASARQARPELIIVARARDARHAKVLYELGATEAVPETIEASLQLSEALLVDIGVPMGLVIASIHEKRDEIRAELNRPDALGARTRKARDRLTGARG